MRTSRVSVVMAMLLVMSGALPVNAGENMAAGPLGANEQVAVQLARQGGAIAVEGQLLDRERKPVSGLVEAFAWPVETAKSHLEVGDSVDRRPVAAAQADSNGHFQVRLDRAAVPSAYLSAAGEIDLELVAWNSGGQAQWFTSVRSDSSGGSQVWVRPTAPDDIPQAQAAQHRASASLALTGSRMPAASIQAAGTDEVTPQIPVCYPPTLQSTHNVWVLIGRSMNYNSTQTSWMVDGSSQSITLGVAHSSQSTVGYSLSGTQSTTSGINFDWAPSSNDRRYYTQVAYGKYVQTCGGVNSYTFRPRYPTGGFDDTLISYDPGWSNCVTVSAGTWTRNSSQGSTTKFSGGVEAYSVISLNLSFESTYSSNRALNYRQTVTRHLCGSNNVPALAGEIEGET